jgi:iron complex transport system substrate-binding protein
VYGEINLEKMAAAAPELIVSCFSPKQDGTVWGFADKTQQAKAEQIAPIVALNGIKVPTAVIAGFEELVAALGVDADSAERVEQRDEFEAAVARLEEATAAKPDLVASAVSFYEGQLYVARPDAFPALRQYVQWGLGLVTPEPGEDPFWDIVSLENVTKYPADLFLTDFLDDKGGVMDKSPTWNSLPAVRAGQTVEWTQLEDWAYPLYTDAVNALADGVESADIVT